MVIPTVKDKPTPIEQHIKNTFHNRTWKLSHGVHVQTHKYDDTLYAFEVTQNKRCLGTIIPKNITNMYQMEYVLNNDITLDGFKCNDDFNTIIRVKKS